MTNATTTDRLAEVLHQMATLQDGNAQPHTIALINELADIAQSQQAENERLREQCEALHEALKQADDAIKEMFRYFDGGETRGSYDGRPERDQLRKAGYRTSTTLGAYRASEKG